MAAIIKIVNDQISIGNPGTLRDDFNRANANPIGGNWTAIPNETSLQIISNRVYGISSANRNTAYWNAMEFAPDQYSQATLAVVPSGGDLGIACRISKTTESLYKIEVSTTAWNFAKYVNGTYSVIGLSQSRANVAGDVFRLTVTGTTLKCSINGVEQVYSVSDTSHKTGAPGINLWGTTPSVDDWEGGNIVETGSWIRGLIRRTTETLGLSEATTTKKTIAAVLKKIVVEIMGKPNALLPQGEHGAH